jgi:hypothetical protein
VRDVATGDSGAAVHVNVKHVRMTLEELKRLPPEELRRRYSEALRLPLPDGKAQ